MAVFGRQKRQSRFYWAELGFMALGLLGLQPSLFTSLLTGIQSKPAGYTDQINTTAQPQSLDFYRDWAASQLVSLVTHPHSGPISTTNGWLAAPITGSQVPSSYGQPGYAAPQYSAAQYSAAQSYGTPQYAAQSYPTQNYTSNYTTPGQFNRQQSSYPQNFAQPTYAPQQQQPYAQPAYQPNASYNTGYGVPTANNANPYGNGVGAGTSPYASQPGYSNPQSNPQSNTGVNSGTWQRYQAPTSSTYYR